MRILLTGANGFIGRNLLASPLAQRYCIDAPRRGELDLRDTLAVDAYLANRTYDVLIHAAVKPGHRNAKETDHLLQTNLVMFENLARHAGRFGRIFNMGSGAVYDTSCEITLARESSAFERLPSDEHGFAKYVIGKRLESLPHAVDCRIFGIFGPYEDWEIRFISNALCKALHGLPITLRQNRRFSYLYAPDLASILEGLIEAPSLPHQAYNLVPPKSITLVDLAQKVQKMVVAMGKEEVPLQIAQTGNGLEYTGSAERLCHDWATICATPLVFTPIDQALLELSDFYTTLKEVQLHQLLHDK
jgi:GDP-L-fucose synthase